MHPRGKINFIAVVLIAALVGGIWALVIFSPAYMDNLDVKDAVRAAYAVSAREDDEGVRNHVLAKVNQSNVGSHKEDDGFGNIRIVGGLGLKDENVIVERDEVRKTISIRVEYVREVQMKPFKKIRKLRFREKAEGPIPAR